MPTQKYTLDLPRLVPEVECLITVDLVAQLVGNRDCLAARTRNRAISAALIFSSHCLKPPLFRHRTKKCLNRCEEAVVMRKSVEP